MHLTAGFFVLAASKPKRSWGNPVRFGRHCPEPTALYRLVQQHAERFIAQAEATGASLLQIGPRPGSTPASNSTVPAHGFLRLRGADCDQDRRVAFSCKRRGLQSIL